MRSSVRLLLLVALLLPFRGALAVSGWLCHTDMPSTSPMSAHAHEHGRPAVADTGGDDADHGPCRGTGEHPVPSHGDASSCNLCSSICGAAAFPTTDARVHGLLPTGAERFMAIAPPHAEFALGALERPPRTI